MISYVTYSIVWALFSNAQANLVTMAIITIILHLLVLSLAFSSRIYNLKQKYHLQSVSGKNGIILKPLNVTFFPFSLSPFVHFLSY